MKQVTIENVKARIAHLEASEHIGGGLPIRHEFEMACLRRLVASLEAEPFCKITIADRGPDAFSYSVNIQRKAAGVYQLFATPQPAPVVPDALEQFAEFMAAESIKTGNYPDGWQCKASNAAHEYAQSCRTAMQGKKNDKDL